MSLETAFSLLEKNWKWVLGGAILTSGYLASKSCDMKKQNARLQQQLEVLAFHASGADTPASRSKGAVIEHDKPVSERTYEQAKLLSEYLLMHFGERLSGQFSRNSSSTSASGGSNPLVNTFELDVGSESKSNFGDFGTFDVASGTTVAPQYPSQGLNFPKRVAELAMHFAPKSGKRALDVGCSVGRTAFELTPAFEEVVGLDYSFMFIDAAKRLAAGESLSFTVPIEGILTFSAKATLDDHVRKERAKFVQGDATALDVAQLGGKFDCVVGANLIDRLPSPAKFLASCAELINSGGVLVLTSPYTWLAEYTPKEEWLGGKESASGERLTTFETLIKTLSVNFTLVHQSHMPFMIRETGRKHQFTYAHATVWMRK